MQPTIDNIADVLQASPAYRPPVHVHIASLLVHEIQQNIAPDVKDGVNACGDEGERCG